MPVATGDGPRAAIAHYDNVVVIPSSKLVVGSIRRGPLWRQFTPRFYRASRLPRYAIASDFTLPDVLLARPIIAERYSAQTVEFGAKLAGSYISMPSNLAADSHSIYFGRLHRYEWILIVLLLIVSPYPLNVFPIEVVPLLE
jgi:hypothetical protein